MDASAPMNFIVTGRLFMSVKDHREDEHEHAEDEPRMRQNGFFFGAPGLCRILRLIAGGLLLVKVVRHFRLLDSPAFCRAGAVILF